MPAQQSSAVLPLFHGHVNHLKRLSIDSGRRGGSTRCGTHVSSDESTTRRSARVELDSPRDSREGPIFTTQSALQERDILLLHAMRASQRSSTWRDGYGETIRWDQSFPKGNEVNGGNPIGRPMACDACFPPVLGPPPCECGQWSMFGPKVHDYSHT